MPSDWVHSGGQVLLWDANANPGVDSLINGIRFAEDTAHRPPSDLAFNNGDHPLLAALSGLKYDLEAGCSVRTGIGTASAEWRELAYTVLPSVSSGQFYSGDEPFGPRWVSLMNPARVPLLLSRSFGQGTIVFAQLGTCNIRPQPNGISGSVDRAPVWLRELAKNVVVWGQSHHPQMSDSGVR